MKTTRNAVFVVVLLLVATATAHAQQYPKATGHVNDYAHLLPDVIWRTLEQSLTQYKKDTSIEIAVVIVPTLNGQTTHEVSDQIWREWGIGKKGEDNGILVILVKDGAAGNRMRIELGYGIQGYITGAEAGRMLDRALPFYEQDDYQLAVESILTDISDELENYVPGTVVKRNDDFPGDYLIAAQVVPSSYT